MNVWRAAWRGMGVWRWIGLALIGLWLVTFVVRYGF
jgi:hypothetical protein